MKSFVRILTLVSLLFCTPNLVNADGAVFNLNKPGEAKPADLPVIIRAIGVGEGADFSLWFFLKRGSSYTVYYSSESQQRIVSREIREDGTTVTVRLKNGNDVTFFVREMRLSKDDKFSINWIKISEADLNKKATDWGYNNPKP